MDILGPFPTSARSNHYIIVADDYVTKWAEAGAIPIAGAAQVAEFFLLEVLLRHGALRLCVKKLTMDEVFRCQNDEKNNRFTENEPPNHDGIWPGGTPKQYPGGYAFHVCE